MAARLPHSRSALGTADAHSQSQLTGETVSAARKGLLATLRAQSKVPGWRHGKGIRSAEFSGGEMRFKKV